MRQQTSFRVDGLSHQVPPTVDDTEYHALEVLITRRVSRIKSPLFLVAVDKDLLWQDYLDSIRKSDRQHYNCHACKRFIQTYGAVVTIDNKGKIKSPLWQLNGVPAAFRSSVAKMRNRVEKAKVVSPFYSNVMFWGRREEGGWTHLHGKNPDRYRNKKLTPEQAMAERIEEFKMLRRAIKRYPRTLVETALRVLRANALVNSEKVLANCEWFHQIHRFTTNRLWSEVAIAPAGWCHINSGMLHTLFEDIRNNLSYEEVERNWRKKMDPLQYRRPQAPPKRQTVLRAEKLVRDLGVHRAFYRRFARLDDVPARARLWIPGRLPRSRTSKPRGMFSHLLDTFNDHPSLRGMQSLTNTSWESFCKNVLPKARSLEVQLPANGAFYGLVTATYKDAPNLFQWDNPVSYYFYPTGSNPYQWQLGLPGSWCPVTMVFLDPTQWDNGYLCNQQKHAFFALQSARDRNTPGLSIFPESIRSEFHEIRAVIEAHSKSRHLTGGTNANANGIAFTDKPLARPLVVRVNKEAVFRIVVWS